MNSDINEATLTDEQLSALARPLPAIIAKFYEDPENEKAFQLWLEGRGQFPWNAYE